MDSDFIYHLKRMVTRMENKRFSDAADVLLGSIQWSAHRKEEKILGVTWSRLYNLLVGRANNDSSN